MHDSVNWLGMLWNVIYDGSKIILFWCTIEI